MTGFEIALAAATLSFCMMYAYFRGLSLGRGKRGMNTTLSSGIIITDDDCRILLYKRSDGLWSIVAGGAKPNEHPIETIQREYAEEVGGDPSSDKLRIYGLIQVIIAVTGRKSMGIGFVFFGRIYGAIPHNCTFFEKDTILGEMRNILYKPYPYTLTAIEAFDPKRPHLKLFSNFVISGKINDEIKIAKDRRSFSSKIETLFSRLFHFFRIPD